MSRTSRRLSSLVALAVGAATLSAVASVGGAATAAPDEAASAVERLRGDATGPLRVVRDRSGAVSFVGTQAGRPVDNPGVSASTSVGAAARSHLERYGAALGTTRAGTSLDQSRALHTVAGTDVVSYEQEVGGLPVLGGGVVVTLDEDRELASALGTLSRATRFPAAKVSAAKAAQVARAAAVKAGARGGFRVVDQGRWVLDPEVAGGSLPDGAIAVHRFEVTDGVALRRMVLVDDQAGRVVMNLDQIQHADRVVCDLNNAEIDTNDPPLCTSGFARTEGQGPVAVADVNDAYALSGAVSDYYDAIGDLDLTQLLGIDVGGQPKLASTVRVCDETQPCPYENAFWNGAQMYYGQDYASADDVVGHEMTHGVIDQYSQLLYWGQSGAMNESMADIMGEIVDQRRTGDGDSDWDLGEDLPIGAIRNLADPTLGEDPDNIANGSPDKMTSPFYWADAGYNDN